MFFKVVRLLMLTAVLCGCFTACKSDEASGKSPCSDGIKLDTLKLPVTFYVERSERALGSVTLSETKTATFKAAANADPKDLKAFLLDFEKAAAGDSISFRYSTRTKSAHYKCGMEVKKSDPKYPAAFKRHLYGIYYTVHDKAPTP